MGSKLHSFPLHSGNLCANVPLRLSWGEQLRDTRLIPEAEIFNTETVMRDEGYAPAAVLDVLNPFPPSLEPDVVQPD